ncbi:MAG TPA: acylphosphatase [Gemmatimonadaceae bacterium]|jgi:acylphosphatase
MPAMRLQVIGRVQGVGFRWYIRVAARRLDLAGWVKNLPDGSVEIAASGPQERLDEFRRAITRGPDGAQVSTVKPLDPIEDLEHPFSVKR